MVQRGDGPRFALEAIVELLSGNFDCHIPPEPRIASFIHFSHASCADRHDDFVRPEAVPCNERHSHGTFYRGDCQMKEIRTLGQASEPALNI
jgi:hypothetical protein